jgi:hypothetical protein
MIKKMLVFCGRCRDRLFSWLEMLWLQCYPRKEDGKKPKVGPDDQFSTKKGNAFIDDKYIEYFEDIENRTKNLEEKFDTRSKNLEEKLENISKNLDDKLDKLTSLLSQR